MIEHSFSEDVSYHGSPTWACVYCGLEEWRKDTTPSPVFCPDAEVYLARKAAQKEADEKKEYRQMLADRQRWEYLNSKYGEGN